MSLWTDLAVWRGPTNNKYGGRRAGRVRGMCLHIAAGYFEGTIAWQKNPDSEISSHFTVGRAGQVAQMVDTSDVAWTQSQGNQEWLTVEFEGFPSDHKLWRPGWEALTSFQIEAAAKLFARGAREFGYPLQVCNDPGGFGLGHHSMGGAAWGGHYQCPGVPILAQKGEITARAQAIAGASPAPAPAPSGRPAPGPALAFPLPRGYFFGPKNGGNESVSGYYGRRFAGRTDREWLQAWADQIGRRGWDVGRGRRWLSRYGNDGRFGDEYAALARAFQSYQGLDVDGLIGENTWNAAFRNPVK